nr:MAG TPA: ECF sigma factor [Caudoviricetes sp.]
MVSATFQMRLENWGRAICGNAGPGRSASPTYTTMIALRQKFGPAAEDAWVPGKSTPGSIDWRDADKLSKAFLDARLAPWDRNVLGLRYGYGRSDKSLARRFHVGEGWMRRRRERAEGCFQRIVEEFDKKTCQPAGAC